MKRKCVLAIAVMVASFVLKSSGQADRFSFIPSAHLAVTYNKTTNLIFPFSVQSIDRGSKDILVQQPKGTENVVQVKAAKQEFTQTNLSVITIDGKLYSFTVDYSAAPGQLNIIVEKEDSTFTSLNTPISLTIGYNEALIKSLCEKIVQVKPKHGRTDKDYQMKFQLNGIYINNNVLYFRLLLQNNSAVSYDVDNINFTVKDKQKSERVATQELSLTPVYSYNSFTSVDAHSSAACVIALPKFTLPDTKFLSIQMLEKNGGRSLAIILKDKHIMKASTISN